MTDLSRRSFLSLTPAVISVAAAAPVVETDVFQSGRDGYHTYRIPAVIRTKKGTLLAFCEGRKHSVHDTGDIDLLVKRSTDDGRTWSAQQIAADLGADTIGNPCPVVDRRSGTILLPLTSNPAGADLQRRVWMARSHDDGVTWETPADITRDVKPQGWTWYATGPGNAIQMRSGRLVVPCDHRSGRNSHSHVILSDDGGATWRYGGSVGPTMDESQVVELRDGSLLLNMRCLDDRHRRAISRSRDGGMTWSPIERDETLIEPVCQASLIRADRWLIFSNPASDTRDHMTVRASADEGQSWRHQRLLYCGFAAYSSLVELGSGRIGCLYEYGAPAAYQGIRFARFPLRWLTEENGV